MPVADMTCIFFRFFKHMVEDIDKHLVGVLDDKTFIWVDMFAGNLLWYMQYAHVHELTK